MENTEKKVWVYTTGRGRSWGNTGVSRLTLMENGEPMTRQEADYYVWDSRSNDADGCDCDMELCENCQGEGCEDCDHEGGWYEEWADVVERNTYGYLEEYDPKVHFTVKSPFPEHIMWLANSTVDTHQRRVNMITDEIAELEEQLEKRRAELGLENVQLAAAKLNLQQVEESLND